MTKIKYDNYAIKKEMSYYQSKDDKELEKLLEDLINRYPFTEPVVTDIQETYDNFLVTIKEKSIDFKKCIVSFPLFSSNNFMVRFNGKYYYDLYEIYEDIAIILKRVYENKKKTCTFEKLYTKNENDKLLRKEKDNAYYTYQYLFKNDYLDCKIAFSFPVDTAFKEIELIRDIFSLEKVDSVFKLYQVILKNIPSSTYKIYVSDHNKDENLMVQDGQIISYRHSVSEDEHISIHEYDRGKLYVTKEEQPEKNLDHQKIFHLVKGDYNEK